MDRVKKGKYLGNDGILYEYCGSKTLGSDGVCTYCGTIPKRHGAEATKNLKKRRKTE